MDADTMTRDDGVSRLLAAGHFPSWLAWSGFALGMALVGLLWGLASAGLLSPAPSNVEPETAEEVVVPPLGLKQPDPPAESLPSDWPNLFGPTHDSVSPETDLVVDWPATGPKELYRKSIGAGYSAPVVQGDDLVVFHRQDDREIVECWHAATGEPRWRFAYPTRYVDRYGYNGGPRCTPILADGKVYTYGAEGKLHALDLKTGAKIWERFINHEYAVEQGFFGVGATPLLVEDRLIVNLGAKKKGAGIVALEAATGKTLWAATNDGASYATPRLATIHGKRHVLVFTEAGLVSVEPNTGKVWWSVPFRSKLYESVNATSPVVRGDLVLVSATYGTGTLCLRVLPDGRAEEVWRGNARVLDSHFSNIIDVDGYLYAFSGRHEGGSTLRCIEMATGRLLWRKASELGRGSSVRIGNRLLLWGERGHLAALEIDPATPRLSALTDRPLLDAPCWTPPTVSRGRLYLRSEDVLLCLDLRRARGGSP